MKRGRGTYHVEVSVGHCSHLTRYSNILEVPSGLLPTALRLHISIIQKFTLPIHRGRGGV
jgi:hypothetical protein